MLDVKFKYSKNRILKEIRKDKKKCKTVVYNEGFISITFIMTLD